MAANAFIEWCRDRGLDIEAMSEADFRAALPQIFDVVADRILEIRKSFDIAYQVVGSVNSFCPTPGIIRGESVASIAPSPGKSDPNRILESVLPLES